MESFKELICQTTAFLNDGVFVAASSAPAIQSPQIIWCNNRLAEILQCEIEALLDEVVHIAIPSTGGGDQKLSYPSEVGQFSRNRLKFTAKDDSCFDLELNLHKLGHDPDGKEYWAGIVADVSDSLQAQKKFETVLDEADLARARLWDAIEALPDAFLMLDADDRLIAFNEKFREFYAHSAPAIFEGAAFGDILRYGLENGQYPEAQGDEDAWLAERLNRASRLKGPINRKLPDNRYLVIHDVETRNGDIVGLRTDVTEFKLQQLALEDSQSALKEAIEVAETASRTDGLTGLSNRRGLDLYLKRLAQAEHKATEVALIHIDLDRFKTINDVFGHAAGDRVLCKVSDILRRSVRADDFVARVGGDEFVVVASDETQAQRVAEGIAACIIAKCKEPVWFGGKELRFGASIGIAVAQRSDLVGLMENADIALYEAKAEGRNRYALFTPRLRALVEEKRLIADELLKGMADDQIVAFFQPQVSSNDYRLIGAEALARWRHPTKGLVPPDVFLPVAEELGVLGDIDDIVLNKTFAAVNRLAAVGHLVPKISVNVSYRRLKTHDIFKRLERLNPWPCKLAFELLETIDFDQDADEFAWILDGLRERGIDIELDDFGSGRASITTLLRVQPQRIKIDQQLVTAIQKDDPNANPLIRAICEMGKAIGIKMTAEGVETEVQVQVLHQLGCDVLQGHLFGTAMSERDLHTWMAHQEAGGLVVKSA